MSTKNQTTNEQTTESTDKSSNHQIQITKIGANGKESFSYPHRMFGKDHTSAFNSLVEDFLADGNKLIDMAADFSKATFDEQDGSGGKIELFDTFFGSRRRGKNQADPRAALAAKLASLQSK